MLLIEFSFFLMSQFDLMLAAGSAFGSPPETVDRKVVAVTPVKKPDAKVRPRGAACEGENEIGEQDGSILFRLPVTLSQTPL